MFATTYACITSYTNGQEFVSVRLCRGIAKAHAQLDDFVETDKIMAHIDDDDEYEIEVPDLNQFKKTLRKHGKLELTGYQYHLVIAKAYYF